MESAGVNQIPKMVKMLSHRTGRFFYKPLDEYPSFLFKTEASKATLRPVTSISHNHPVVVTSVTAGVLGVILVLILIFSVWIRRRCYRSLEEQQKLALSASHLEFGDSHKEGIINPNAVGTPEVIQTVMPVIPEEFAIHTKAVGLDKVQVV